MPRSLQAHPRGRGLAAAVPRRLEHHGPGDSPVRRHQLVGGDMQRRQSRGGQHGSIPASLDTVGFLTELDVSSNTPTGPIPSSLGGLEFITSRYEISPALFPRLLANAVNLKVLYLGGNYFTGTLPASWGLMKAMEDIDLAYNEELSGTHPLAPRDERIGPVRGLEETSSSVKKPTVPSEAGMLPCCPPRDCLRCMSLDAAARENRRVRGVPTDEALRLPVLSPWVLL